MKKCRSYITINKRSILFLVLIISGKILTATSFFNNEIDPESKTTVTSLNGPWENMGNDVRLVCDPTFALEYEWGVSYNNVSPIIRVTCNTWNSGNRVCTYPPYPTGDTEPFTWGGACWIWGTNSTLDDACSIAYHGYFYQNATGQIFMTAGNGCNALPTVWRRKL